MIQVDSVTDFPDALIGSSLDQVEMDEMVWAVPDDATDALDSFDWQSIVSPSPSTTLSSISDCVDSPQWSLDSDEYSSSGPNKRVKSDALKLQRNKEAAARSRLKRKQESKEKANYVSDLENQIASVKQENEALKLENMTLRADIAALREKVANFAFENKASVSGVAVFGIVCLFPLFSSTDTQSDLYSSVVGFFSALFSATGGGMHGRVLLSDDSISASLSLLGWYGFLGAVVVGLYMYWTHRALALKLSSAPVLPRAAVTKSEAALKLENQAKKRGIGFRVSGLRVWLSDYAQDTNLPK
jgi:hypothetical protein